MICLFDGSILSCSHPVLDSRNFNYIRRVSIRGLQQLLTKAVEESQIVRFPALYLYTSLLTSSA